MSLSQSNRIAAIGTPLGPDVLCLESFAGHEELARLFEYNVRLLSENDSIKFESIIGHNVTVRLETTLGSTRYFNGIVSGFSQLPSTSHYAVYSATIVPWLWLLTRTSDCRIWSGADETRSVPDIIKALFTMRGFTDFEDATTSNHTPWDYCVQYRETDFNFVSRLMEQEGIYYYFKHENAKHTLVLADSVGDRAPFPRYATLHYKHQGPGSSEIECIRDWTLKKELLPCKYVHNDFDFLTPSKDLCTDPAIKNQTHAQADFTIYDYPGEFTSEDGSDDGSNWAQIRIDELQSRQNLLHGCGDARGMAAGFTFNMKDLPRDDQNQEYLIVSVAHNIRMGGYESNTDSSRADTYNCTFTVLPTTQEFRPARHTPKPMIQGPQTAVVAGPSGDEIYTDKHGRVKLKFHWDRYSNGDDKSSFWVRVSHACAGNQWGAIYIPRIGQEVIVEYLEGDPDQPIVTGRVYNGEAMPPYKLPDHKTRSTIKSNSSIGGQGFNEIRFEDDSGNEQIFIHAEKDEDLRVKNDSREWIGNDRHLIVVNDQKEQVQGNKHLTVQGNRVTQIQGNQGEAVLGDNKTSITGNDHMTVKSDQKIKITGNQNLDVGQNSNNKCGGDLSFNASMDIYEKSGMNHAVDAGMTVHIKGGMSVVIEGGMEVSIKAGGNFIDIGPAGVAISGTLVMINSGGAAGSGPDCSPNDSDDPDSPDSPDAPKEADDADTGSATSLQATADQDQTGTAPDSVTVDDMSSGGGGSGGAGGAFGDDSSNNYDPASYSGAGE